MRHGLARSSVCWRESLTTVSPLTRFHHLCGCLAVFALGVLPLVAGPNDSCLECHSDETLTAKRGNEKVSLHFDAKLAAASVHHALDCADCHEKYDGDSIPHRAQPAKVDCASCHEKLGRSHVFHPRLGLAEIPTGRDTNCIACHGTRGILAIKSPASPFKDGAQITTCGKCHVDARAHFVDSAHGRAVATHEENAPDCISCHRQKITHVTGAAPALALAQKNAQARLCESCHLEKPSVAAHSLRGGKFIQSFSQSVHGAALQAGEAKSANCVDCHGAHETNRAIAPGARVNKQHIAETCAACHEKAAHEFSTSAHAKSLGRGNLDSPSCTDCHGQHDIRAPKDPTSPVNRKNVTQQVCANCHASLRLTQKYGLPSNSFETFADSYHGLAVRGGAVEVVNCASCHSAHAIKSASDPSSTINKANLAQTCGQCHPGANTRFTVGRVHVSAEAAAGKDGNSPILYLISATYLSLIFAVVGGMVLHNALDLFRKIRRKLALQKGLIEEHHVAHRLYLRMTVHERLQHGMLVLSFCWLVVTGFMLRFPEAWWVVAIRDLSGRAFELRSWIHRGAGVAMLIAGAWHVSYLAFSRSGRALFFDLLPRRRDFTDPIGVLRFNLGLTTRKPQFGRFCYIEKTEYWAMIWGTLLMGVTGAVLWFDNTSLGLFTKLGFDIARTIHYYEAVLATLAVIVWHFYFVIFNPDIYPMNLAWLTGRMSEKEMLEEHPADLPRLRAAKPKSSSHSE